MKAVLSWSSVAAAEGTAEAANATARTVERIIFISLPVRSSKLTQGKDDLSTAVKSNSEFMRLKQSEGYWTADGWDK